MKFQNGNHTKYISFKKTNTQIKLGILYSNNLRNIELEYEIFKDLDINNTVQVRGKEYNIKDYLLELEVDKVKLFIVVEQGGGKMSKYIMVVVSLKAKIIVRKWVSEIYRTVVKIKNRNFYKTLFLLCQALEKSEYEEKLK